VIYAVFELTCRFRLRAKRRTSLEIAKNAARKFSGAAIGAHTTRAYILRGGSESPKSMGLTWRMSDILVCRLRMSFVALKDFEFRILDASVWARI